jgi:HPt (histidine-containing phosphotransfer) domain-containing protein
LHPIDKSAFDDLRAHTSDGFVAELVAAFMQEAPKMLADLRRGRDAADAELFRRAAHTLKSNSATFGAMELVGMARAMELGGLEADAASDHGAIDELEGAWHRAAAVLQEMARG